MIGENSDRDTAANVVTKAISRIERTSSLLLDDLQYQNAPSTATAKIMGNAIASIIEISNPNAEINPASAAIISPTLPNVTNEIFQSLITTYITNARNITEGINIDVRSSSATTFAFWNSMLTPTASTSNSVASLTFSAHNVRLFQSVPPSLSTLSSHMSQSISSELGACCSFAPGNEGQATPKFASFGRRSRVVSKALDSMLVDWFPHQPPSIGGWRTSAHLVAFSKERFLDSKASDQALKGVCNFATTTSSLSHDVLEFEPSSNSASNCISF